MYAVHFIITRKKKINEDTGQHKKTNQYVSTQTHTHNFLV